ncbi:MAG: ATP-binding protein [Cyanobacteriota bacterium]
MKIKIKLVLYILVPLLIFLVLINLVYFNYMSNFLEDKASQVLLNRTIEINNENQHHLNEITTNLYTLLFNRKIDEYFMYKDVDVLDNAEDARWQIEMDFLKVARLNHNYDEIRLIDLDGKDIISIIDKKISYSKKNSIKKEFIDKAKILSKDESIILLEKTGNKKKGHYIIFLIPFLNQVDQVKGFGLIKTSLKELVKELIIIDDIKNQSVYWIDNKGEIVFSLDNKVIGKNVSEYESVKNVINDKTGTITEKSFSNNNYMKKAYIPTNIPDLKFILEEPMSEISEFGKGLQTFNIFIIVISIIIVSITSFFTAEIFTKPILKLRNFALKVSEGNLDEKINIETADEIGQLASVFNEMVEKLKARTELLENEVIERRNINKELQQINIELQNKEEILLKQYKKIQENMIELEKANEQKTRFLSTMSHELRTPLNAVLGFSEVLDKQYFGQLNEKQLEYIKLINQSGNHLLLLINDILDIAKIEADTIDILPEKFNIDKEINEILQLMKTQVDEKHLQLVSDVDSNIETIYYDKRKFRQILFNLLSNAFKFTPDGKKVSLLVQKISDELIKVSVIDEGLGINQEDINKVFDEFYQSHDTTKRALGGTGIGLALTRKLVEMHHGEIGVESEEGKGSHFWFTILVKNN